MALLFTLFQTYYAIPIYRGRRGSDRIVGGFTLKFEFEFRSS